MTDTFFDIPEPPRPDETSTPAPAEATPPTFSNTPAQASPTHLPPLRDAASLREVHLAFSRLGLSMLILSIVMQVAGLLIDSILLRAVPAYTATVWWRTWVLSLLPLYGFGLPMMLLTLRRLPKAPHNTDCRDGEKPRFTVGNWLILLVIGMGCMYIGSLVGNLIMSILTVVTGYPYADGLQSMIEESPMWMTLLGACVCAPLGEEFIFRKLLIDRSRRYGDTVSILLSGFFFGLFHGNLFQFFYAFLLGVILAYIYTRTGNLWWCVGMHAVVNVLGGVVMPALSGLLPTDVTNALELTPTQALINLGLTLWICGLIIAAIVLVCVRWRKRRLSLGAAPLLLERAPAAVLLNPGMIANFTVMCLLMVLNLLPVY